MEQSKRAFFSRVVEGKCPFCSGGDIFQRKGNIFKFKAPKMNTHCSSCGHKFDEEPGFFYGAMYISYFLGAIQMIIIFATLYFPTKSFAVSFSGVLLTLVFMSFFNFRISRIIWILLFSSKK